MSSLDLVSDDEKIVAAVEKFFWLNSKMPAPDLIVRETMIDYQTIVKTLDKPEIKEKLLQKGIISGYQAERMSSYLAFLEIAEETGLDPLQVKVANMLLNTSDRRSERKKLEDVGVTPQRLAAWKRQPAFNKYLKERATHVFGDLDVAAHMSMSRMIQDDNVQAVKLYYEMTGLYTPKAEVNVKINVNLVLATVVEVISRFVDEDTAINIADAIEAETRELLK